MHVVTHRVGPAVLVVALVAAVLAAVWPTSAGAATPAGPDPAGVTETTGGSGGAVLGPAVAYVRDSDGTVRRIR